MTIDPRIDLHDNVAWGPNGGRASDVPPTGMGSNPFEQEETETAKAPAVFEIVRLTKDGGPLTKEISLNDDGSTRSDGSACIMPRGIAERIPLAGVDELAKLITGLSSDQAIALGALRWDLPDQVSVVTKRRLQQLNGHAGANVIARTDDSILYRKGEPGFALCDYDSKGIPPEVEAKLKSHGTYWNVLCEVLPELKGAAYVKRRSTSAGLLRTDAGEKLPGSKGLHIYIAVKDSGDIERFLKTLHDRCCLAGYGWMMVGKAGQLLDRSIVDRMVGAPERLVFEGKPVLVPPLDQDQDARRPVAVEGEIFDTVALCPPLSLLDQARLEDKRAKARYAIAGESAKARTAFIDEQAERLVRRTGKSRTSAGEIAAKQCNGILLPTIELPFDDPDLAGTTVGDVLVNPTRFEGETLADPLEGVAYGKCKAKIMLRADGTPWINSFAHGRTVYELKLDADAVQAAMDAASEYEVLSTFLRFAFRARLDSAEIEKLITHANKRTGCGKRTIRQMYKDAQKERAREQRQAEQDRKAADRKDTRPLIQVPKPDAEWAPVVKLILDVLGNQKIDEPPMRNRDGMLVQRRVRKARAMHAFGNSAANGEDAGGDDTRLPPPDQHLLTLLDEIDTAQLIEKYIEFCNETDRSVHLPSIFVAPVMKGLPDDLPVVDAIATLPLVMPNGAWLAGTGLDRDYGILFKIDPGIQRLMPRPQDCDSDRVAKAMRFLTEEWLCDVSTTYAGKCVLIAAALTIVERTLFPERPDFYVTAGRRGGGKTTALTMLIMAIMGTRPAAAAWTDDVEERKKALFSYLMEGVAYILWDNIPRGTLIDCPHIQKASTSDTVTDRILGVSKTASASAAAIHLFTGNNIGPKGDSVSRGLQARIEVERTDPENRPFRHSEPGWTEANRPKILQALYTILLGNPELKKPRNAPAKTRFKLWWRVVGAAIENAAKLHAEAIDPAAYDAGDQGRPVPIDFQRLFISQEADDEEGSSLADALDILNRRWPAGTFKAADVAKMINENGTTPDGAVVREFLFAGVKGDQIATSKSVAKRLGAHVGNPVMHSEKTLTLCSGSDRHSKTQTFFVKETKVANPAPANPDPSNSAPKAAA
jgi:hypothetical protein